MKTIEDHKKVYHKAASADRCYDLSICKRMFTKQSKLSRSFINCLGFAMFETIDGVKAYDGLFLAIEFTIKTNK